VRADPEKRQHPRSDGNKGNAKLLVDGFEATLVDFSSSGLRIEVTRRLDTGTAVRVSGEIEGSAGRILIGGPCQVRWCSETGPGLFHAGLSFDRASDIPSSPKEMLGNGIDYYEVLQVSRRADADTIRRVYHLMAQRYHPDNRETGNDELFRQIVKAEVIKRQAILRLLYNQRFTDADRPWIVLRDFENLMGCPREHLEFSFWVLREGKLVTRGDNARYEITYQGVAAVEAEETGGQPPAIFPLLTAPTRPPN
jgi:DnaJ domain/PilZ domain